VGEFTDQRETDRGKALFQELLWVHRMVRRDLDTVRRLADECLEGRPAEELAGEIRDLQTNGPLWMLKVNCLRYCSFVHSHHNAEDALLFPRLREANPEIGPVVDRLESEHRNVSGLLDEVEDSARSPSGAEGIGSRRRLADGLTRLADDLLAHLSFEEENVRSTMSRLPGL
jgi:hemerythrin-like domain-containing protein